MRARGGGGYFFDAVAAISIATQPTTTTGHETLYLQDLPSKAASAPVLPPRVAG